MKKLFAILLLVIFARPAAAQDKIKIGFVDIQRAISESQSGKKAREKFQAEVKKVEGELLKEKQEMEKLKNDFDKKGLLLKEEEKKNLEREFQRRYLGYQRSMRDFQEELRQKEGEMTGEILKELEKVVLEIGKSEKFTLVLERSQVLYSDQAIDITSKVIELYNSRPGGKASKAK